MRAFIRRVMPILTLALWYLMVFATSCRAEVAPQFKALDKMLEARTSDGAGGWCAPIGADVVVTAAHVAAHPIVYCGGVMVRTIGVDTKHDIAVMRAPEDSYSAWYKVRLRAPEPGERLYWRFYLHGLRPAVATGLVMGEDDHGFFHIDGLAIPGASGSGVLDENGELVAIVSAAWNPEPKDGYWRSTVLTVALKEILK